MQPGTISTKKHFCSNVNGNRIFAAEGNLQKNNILATISMGTLIFCSQRATNTVWFGGQGWGHSEGGSILCCNHHTPSPLPPMCSRATASPPGAAAALQHVGGGGAKGEGGGGKRGKGRRQLKKNCNNFNGNRNFCNQRVTNIVCFGRQRWGH